MTLYKATREGNIPMTTQEESEIRAEWAANSSNASAPQGNVNTSTLENRVAALEAEVAKIKLKAG